MGRVEGKVALVTGGRRGLVAAYLLVLDTLKVQIFRRLQIH